MRCRLRLIVTITLPLIFMVAGGWQFRNARDRAADIFERGFLPVVPTISRGIALSGKANGRGPVVLHPGEAAAERFLRAMLMSRSMIAGAAWPGHRSVTL